ncbi:hypothetical protein NUW58_g7047 [Xylaria curta]|uniref:Uncharacterized protein n=1 Tax=Xylaria curta TaxID=42375 RepID=A0ACC1NMG7_9PEZI|nr:hypothetical protein NUW58_g7047 [Xylaria curta]
MSSPSCQPENAATAARVSESLPVTPISHPSVSAAAATDTVTTTDEQPSSFTALTGSPPILDTCPTAVVSPPLSDDSSVPVSSSAIPSSAIFAGHGDHINKRSRPPLALSRSNGPSLLTQALASARGIPSSTAPQTDQRQPDHPYTQPNDPSPRSNHPKHVYDNTQELTLLEPRHDALTHCSDTPNIPATQTRIGPTRAISSPTLHASGYPTAAPVDSSSITMPGIIEKFPVIWDHPSPYFMSRARGRSLGRTEKEARLHRINATELPLDVVGASAYNCGDSSFSRYDDSEANSDSRAEYRAWRTERTVSMGPEKAWSIGTGDIVGDQDGQVEKSITEVLAGMEPTRSRKASYSLRFFKEGLPDDKVKRKEFKPTSQYERTSPSKGQHHTRAVPNRSPNISTPPHLSIEVEAAQPPSRAEHLPSSNHTTQNPIDRFAEGDYFSPRKNESVIIEPVKTQDYAKHSTLSSGLINRSRTGSKEMEVSRKMATHDSAASANNVIAIREPVEEGEESSEEKISSAVFLPHQSLEDSAGEGSCVIEKVEPQHPSTRSSTKKDFHPWLVKADEPEAEGKSLTDVHHEDALKGRKDGVLPGRDLPNKHDHADGVPIENELKTKPCDIPAVASRPVSRYYEDLLHEHQLEPKIPLEAIELIPYKHQVGGHTTIWRFSKRAVCKQLNNRENEFYEKIERFHRDLLPFLPRYIGVLNVTYQKQPRRRSTARKDESSGAEKTPAESDIQSNGTDGCAKTRIRRSSNGYDEDNHRRIVSQSLRSGYTPIPTVTFVDNQHIVPRSLLQPSMVSGLKERPRSASAATIQHRTSDMSSPTPDHNASRTGRPTLEDRHTNSWGATMVNKKLRNEVFNDAFLKQPITIHKHQRPASYHRSVPRRLVQPRYSTSATAVPTTKGEENGSALSDKPGNIRTQANLQQSHSDLGSEANCIIVDNADHVKDVTGTSAPEAEVLGEKFSPRVQKRRYSGSKLRRKPQDVGESRGDLKYFEDADDVRYGTGDETRAFSPLLKDPTKNDKGIPIGMEYGDPTKPELLKDELRSGLPSAIPDPDMELRKIPRPVNPKEAQTQRNSRVEYFLLLEDLTAGMKRPCIMDLKMGTRQYGVDANPKKQESQRRKCAETTSRELGVRVCGLQTWDAKSQAYVFRDKYYGRSLKAGKEFQDTLTMFLYDGVDYSSVLRHIPTILQKLNQLEVTIRRLHSYRFYAASLLMFYDAGAPGDGNDTAAEDSTTDFATDTEDAWEGRRHKKNRAEIDFKMADFANSVTAGDLATNKPCPPKHPNEPDRGFLRGLATLRKYFLQIQKDLRREMGLNPQRKHDQDASITEDDYDELSVSE